MSEPRRLSIGIRDSTFGDGCVVADCVNVYQATFGDRCFVGPFVEVQNDVVCGTNVRIQSHTLVCEGMRIGDDVFIGHGVMTANSRYPQAGAADWTCEPPVVGDRVSIGSNATILPGVTIGDDAVIGSGAVVSRDVAAGTIVVGTNRVLEKPEPA
ncbi:MAG: N-acetyltransferase [Actinomycetales bacterium]|nr:MAG: N-acetyltransferase [Actinomycetales bacterium]